MKYTLVVRNDDLSKKLAEDIRHGLKDELTYDNQKPDLVISVGGDGTILEAVHQYMDVDCYYVGIHTGTLGFFTDYQRDEVDELIHDIKKNEYHCMPRHLLEVKVHLKDETKTLYALNEMRLDHGFSTQVISVYINDVLLEVFRGNGLCVSTPSGSTAYNKSLGGALIYPGIPLMQLTEVAGIHHNAYRSLGSSLILDDRQTIKLKGDFKDLWLGIDHLQYSFQDVESIEVHLSKRAMKFIEYKEMSFIKRVRRAYIHS